MKTGNPCEEYEYAAGEITLPFSYTATVSSEPRPQGLDFPHEPNPDNCQVFVRIEEELWQFRCPWILGKPKIMRYRGPNIDQMVQVEDGEYPKELTCCWFLGGMWYNESERKLYAPMHVEQGGIHRLHPLAKWSSRKIILATSIDNGKTWRYEGEIITPETYYYNHDSYKFSGSCYGNGLSDYGFYADTRGGYFYIFAEEGWYHKGQFGAFWNVRVARCAIEDNMAPGKWKFFYNGEWKEPALGGKSSVVAPSHMWNIIYSTYMEKYICMFPSNSDHVTSDHIDGVYIGLCSDLAKQDWMWGYFPDTIFGFMSVFNEDGSDLTTCGQTFRHYSYGAQNTFQRTDITLLHGETVAADVTPRYHFQAHPESSDPVLGRKTKIVGAVNSDIRYSEAWTDRLHHESYEGKMKVCAAAGNTIEYTFQGSDIYWRAVRSPMSGKADVYIDGVLCKSVDCYHPQSTIYEQFVYIKTGLDPNKEHSIKVIICGERNPKSLDTEVQHIAFEYAAESYKASAGFSSINGKNNWHYQQFDGTNYSDMRFVSNDLSITNYWFGEENCTVGPTYQIPDGQASVRKWEAPHGGTVRIEGNASCQAAGNNGSKACILHNNFELWPEKWVIYGRPVKHDIIVNVKQGDEIRFMVNKGHEKAAFDKVFWDPVITFTKSKPAVWILNSPGHTNLAEGKYARSKYLVDTYRPFNAVDGLATTAFIVHADDPISIGDDWLIIYLEKEHRIDSYTVTSAPKYRHYNPQRFVIQKSDDGILWTDIDSVESNFSGRVERKVKEFYARYVRVYLPAGKPFQINEFELYYKG